VADVAVIGVPDARWGEIVLAAVVLKEGQKVEDDEVKSTVRARLAGFKVPKRMNAFGLCLAMVQGR
jgi:acyl-CoA synthetase (AMP-forming)/AMP-acid ligase II